MAPPPEAGPSPSPSRAAWRLPLGDGRSTGCCIDRAGAFSRHPSGRKRTRTRPTWSSCPSMCPATPPKHWRPFADQVTRELIRNLRNISGLRVVPASSAFTFKENKERESHPAPTARRAVRARWCSQHLSRQQPAHHRGARRSAQGPHGVGQELRGPYRRHESFRNAVQNRRRGVGVAESRDPGGGAAGAG